MINVLCTVSDFKDYCPEALRLLKSNGFNLIQCSRFEEYDEAELMMILSDVEAIILGTDIINDNIFRMCPNLRIITRFGVGIDNIDLESAREHDVVVNNAAGINSTAVAEFIISIILASYRNIPAHDNDIKGGKWNQKFGRQLSNKNVGLVGFGNIAKKLCPLLTGFNVSISAYDKNNREEEAYNYNVKLKSLELIFVESDIVIILLPYQPELENIVSNRLLSLMHNGSLIINAARGKLLDPVALYDKINEKNIYAALDVYREEPMPVNYPLLIHPNVVATPHIAAATIENYKATGLHVADTIINFFVTGEVLNRLA